MHQLQLQYNIEKRPPPLKVDMSVKYNYIFLIREKNCCCCSTVFINHRSLLRYRVLHKNVSEPSSLGAA